MAINIEKGNECYPINEIIYYIRSLLGLSQEAFAKLINCSRQRIARAEGIKNDESVDPEIICKAYILLDTIVKNETVFNLKEFPKSVFIQLKEELAKEICCTDVTHLSKFL